MEYSDSQVEMDMESETDGGQLDRFLGKGKKANSKTGKKVDPLLR